MTSKQNKFLSFKFQILQPLHSRRKRHKRRIHE